MEDTLRDQQNGEKDSLYCLNPYYNGRYSTSAKWHLFIYNKEKS